jgi:hypothetical protein
VPNATYTYNANSWKNILPPWDPAAVALPPNRTLAEEQASWSTGTVGLGFDVNPTFGPHISTTVSGMQGVNSSIYVRIPFTVTAEQKAAMTGLTLKLKYDDGVFVWVNATGAGSPLLRLNADPTASPAYNNQSIAARADTDAVTYQSIDLTPQIAGLIVGSDNVISIQGLNFSAADDDFLLVPELVATTNAAPPPGATAVAYTGPLTLPQSGPVRARVLKNGIWSPLTEASFIVGVPASAANLTISEFSYNPVASESEITAGFTSQQFEYVELMNISADPLEMTGCRFDDGISFDFPVDSAIAPGQRIVLVANQAAFEMRHPGVPVYGVFANESNLSNSGERLEFLSAAGTPIFDFVYDDKSPWPVSPDGDGFSLVLINPLSDPDPSAPSNWRASAAPGGTPGTGDADSFAAWATRNGVTGTMTDDFNGNGLSNLLEYGLGLNSAGHETDGFISARFETIEVTGVSDTYMVVRYRRNNAADDVLVTPEMSLDMVNWTPLIDDVVPPVSNPDGTLDAARRSPQPVSGGARIYVRVSVTTR